jgi:hypothetical protein
MKGLHARTLAVRHFSSSYLHFVICLPIDTTSFVAFSEIQESCIGFPEIVGCFNSLKKLVLFKYEKSRAKHQQDRKCTSIFQTFHVMKSFYCLLARLKDLFFFFFFLIHIMFSFLCWINVTTSFSS